MRISSIFGYVFGFGLIAVCAILASGQSQERHQQSQRQQTERQKRTERDTPYRSRFFLFNDKDGDDFLSRDEFLNGYLNHESSRVAQLFYPRVFELMDENQDDRITQQQMSQCWEQLMRKYRAHWNQIEKLDEDYDGQISAEESKAAADTKVDYFYRKFEMIDFDHNQLIDLRDREMRTGIYLQLVVPDWWKDPKVIEAHQRAAEEHKQQQVVQSRRSKGD